MSKVFSHHDFHEEDHPSAKQAEASNPLRSVWVGASAGTGKTKVLIDRVLRLMLPRQGMGAASATAPNKILCLTFTKTAAAEMSSRIYQRLSEWSVKSDSELEKELKDLNGTMPDNEMQEEARKLFARVLDTPGGLKIMTIHSFCQSVLKRFPVEAGLPPHFQLMDEQNAIEYLTKCLHNIIGEVSDEPNSVMAKSFNNLTLHLDSNAMSELMQQIMSKRSVLTEILKNHGDIEGSAENTISQVYNVLGVKAGLSESDIFNEFKAASDGIKLKQGIEALLKGSAKDIEKAETIGDWLVNADNFYLYKAVFLTKDGDIRKSLATKAARDSNPDIEAIMYNEAERLLEVSAKLKALKLAELNSALLTVAAAMVGHYAQYKRYRDMLDFDDLIIKTCELLAEENMVPWVLYKLDNGIDHILVDEAQDTSRNQWKVVKSLSEEFFSGRGSQEDVLRTLFVVGDEKQSIFSFQGADPSEFAEMQKFFGEKVLLDQDGWEVLLTHSFRSTAAVLEVVDRIFASEAVRRGVVCDINREVKHQAFRAGEAGMVELWPLVKSAAKEKPQPWQMPSEIDMGDSSASDLANKIAATIKGWLTEKDLLLSKNRPVRAGDILILVQSRGAIVELLMRALKTAGVPVAGVDRITLLDEIAIIDMLALAQFALLPKDDLTLAGLLKSPLIGINEEELYNICYGRQKTSLWVSLRNKKPEIAAWLQKWINIAGKATPYEFFSAMLNTSCFADDVSGRKAFYSRLGFDIQDAVDEFLNVCLIYEQSHVPSLQKFVDWFLRGATQIKREQETGDEDLVRIMTVHASKGLQAPIVFLPDTVKKLHDHNKGRVRLLWPKDESGVPLWSSRKEFDAPLYAEKQRREAEKQEEEYRRLLYVALTRAEDRLYICGYRGVKKEKADCWYNLVAENFPTKADKISFEINGGKVLDEEGNILTTLRFEYGQELEPKEEKTKIKRADVREALPLWARQKPADEPVPPKPLAPSKPEEDDPTVNTPLAESDNWKFNRGNTVHKLLELLPELPLEKREFALRKYLARPALNMPKTAQDELAGEILAVLNHSEFAEIFGENSQAEVPIVGLTGSNILSGQIDRLLVTENEVLIIDYKSNRNAPSGTENIPKVYIKQLALYAATIQKIYPNHKVKCALLWTEAPRLMLVPDSLLSIYST